MIKMNGERIVRRRRKNWFLIGGVFVAIFLFTFLTHIFKNKSEEVEAVNLANFDPGYIISDYQMGNYNSMNETEIQRFLKSKNSCNDTNITKYTVGEKVSYFSETMPPRTWHVKNGHFVCLADEDFNGESAAHIIYRAAQDYKINPQVLIVLLEKEQSLITDTFPHSGQYRSATGYGCPDTAACSSKYYGFRNQVRNAASLFRTVLNGGWTNYPLGNNYIQYNPSASCGGSVVNIRNLATSALYRYTPYQPNAATLGGWTDGCNAYGNLNFYKLFEGWFGGITGASRKPSAPRNITQTNNVDNRSITIKWDKPADTGSATINKYTIVIAGRKTGEINAEVDGDTYEYKFSNLPVDTYYASSVRADNNAGYDYGRITFDVVISETETLAPQNISAKKNNKEIIISWKKPKDTGGVPINKYQVVIAGRKTGETKVDVSGDTYQYSFNELLSDDYYATSVKAFNNISGSYGRITFNINLPVSSPTKPQNIRVYKKNGRIWVNWDKPRSIGGAMINKYTIVIAGRKTGETKAEVDGDTYEYMFDNLNGDTYYAASVRADNVAGYDYGRITFNINYPSIKPSAPRNITQTNNVDNRSITIKWDKPADTGSATINKYTIVIAGRKTGEINAEVDGDTYEYKFSNLPVDTYYASSVRADNNAGYDYGRITFDVSL